jgi:hypothetical protein
MLRVDPDIRIRQVTGLLVVVVAKLGIPLRMDPDEVVQSIQLLSSSCFVP